MYEHIKEITRVDKDLNVNSGRCIVTIIHSCGSVKLYPDEEITTLKQCREIAVKCGHKRGTIMVLLESPLNGYVYKYGNHGDYWERVGELAGYA